VSERPAAALRKQKRVAGAKRESLRKRCGWSCGHNRAPQIKDATSIERFHGSTFQRLHMSRVFTLAVLSDVHYFSAAEAARGRDYEMKSIPNPLIRHALRVYRHYIWLRHPFDHSHLLDKFIERVGPVDRVIGNGDYSCDSAFVGVSDDAACESARDCLGKLRGGSFRFSVKPTKVQSAKRSG